MNALTRILCAGVGSTLLLGSATVGSFYKAFGGLLGYYDDVGCRELEIGTNLQTLANQLPNAADEFNTSEKNPFTWYTEQFEKAGRWVNDRSGTDYMNTRDQLEYYEGAVDALRELGGAALEVNTSNDFFPLGHERENGLCTRLLNLNRETLDLQSQFGNQQYNRVQQLFEETKIDAQEVQNEALRLTGEYKLLGEEKGGNNFGVDYGFLKYTLPTGAVLLIASLAPGGRRKKKTNK